MIRHSVIALSLFFVATNAQAAEPKLKPAEVEFFEKKIRPVLVEQCYRCHSAQAAAKKKLKGELQLDTRAGIRKGGESGPAVVPGDLKKSLLVEALSYGKLKMPPNKKLPDAVIADFKKWIAMGAPDPREGVAQAPTKAEIDIAKGRKHWAFQPLAKVQPPAVKNGKWAANPIDRFILAPLEAKGLQPAEPMERRRLIRRVYFGLVGLPPPAEEVERFVNDKAPDAQARLVDRLLASEHYGERWARHWLDLARFAESNGYAFDKDRPNAYHYRDFVIKSLNQDMPYDQFVRMQIAGDLLTSNDYMGLAATGFVVGGPFTTQQTAKERERSRYEQLDDMVSTVGTAMLGLTLGCARCHDHKFDPLPQHDYYRLIASFREVGFRDVGWDPNPAIYKQAKAEYDRAHAPLVARRTKYENEKLPAALAAWLKSVPEKRTPPKLLPWQQLETFQAKSFDEAFTTPFAPEQAKDHAKLTGKPQPSWADGKPHKLALKPNGVQYLARIIEAGYALPVELSFGADEAIKVWLNGQEIAARKKIANRADQELITLLLRPGKNVLLVKIANSKGPAGFIFRLKQNGPPKNIEAILNTPADKRNDKQKAELLRWFRPFDAGWQKLEAVAAAHRAKEPKPKLTPIYAAQVKGTTYNFGGNTFKVFHLRRGNADQKQEPAEPGYLRVLMTAPEQDKHWLGKDKPARIALADWLVDTKEGAGALLARVIVNRLWQHHFGRGIVATPSDFGTRGAAPTHPELLDFLAQELIRNQWKLKPIQRLILTSSAYQQGGTADAKAMKLDPYNQLFHRQEPQRLEAEIIRDALLSVSGTLDDKMYGAGTRNAQDRRRSVYLTVKRSALIPFLQIFDAPDAMQSIGNRPTTTVAPQALALMNSPFVQQLAVKVAQRARPSKDVTLEQAIEQAYRLALSRPPSSEEKTAMLAFVKNQAQARGQEQLALADLCHLLLCSNEFVYVD